MIDCTSAYNAARVLLDDDKIDIELMTKIGYECPAFTRLVYMSRDNNTLLLLLKSLERANVDVYKIERGLRYALGQKVVYNNATLQKADDADTYSEASAPAPVHDDNAAAFVLDLDKENMRMLEHKLNIFHTMTARELYKACVDRDIAKLCKDKKKPTLIAALRKYEIEHAATSGIVIEDNDADAADTHENAPDAPYSQYSAMTVQELYDECKQRDMDVPARQRKQIYIDLLTSDDNIKEAQSGDNLEDIDMTNPGEWEI
jgi:hypothetical protein